jgi:hypothetical protein
MSMFEVVILKLNFAIIYMEKLLVEYFFSICDLSLPLYLSSKKLHDMFLFCHFVNLTCT